MRGFRFAVFYVESLILRGVPKKKDDENVKETELGYGHIRCFQDICVIGQSDKAKHDSSHWCHQDS